MYKTLTYIFSAPFSTKSFAKQLAFFKICTKRTFLIKILSRYSKWRCSTHFKVIPALSHQQLTNESPIKYARNLKKVRTPVRRAQNTHSKYTPTCATTGANCNYTHAICTKSARTRHNNIHGRRFRVTGFRCVHTHASEHTLFIY
jgi:hypothetical protein